MHLNSSLCVLAFKLEGTCIQVVVQLQSSWYVCLYSIWIALTVKLMMVRAFKLECVIAFM